MRSLAEREKNAFKLITYAGDARSCYIECMQLFHGNQLEAAKQALIDGNQVLHKGNAYIEQYAGNEKATLLLELHALDLLMNAEILKFATTQLLDIQQYLKK